MTARGNNFDLLRLIFASSVVFWHAYTLSRQRELEPLALLFSADLAVKAFFVVSGYLVVMSCERSSSVGDYAAKRARRIYPAYAAVVVGCAIGAAFLSTVPAAGYFSGEFLQYVLANLVFLNFLAPNLPGVFSANPWTEVNGALWTLKIEVMFYVFVPVLVLLVRRMGAGRTLIALYALSVAYSLSLGALHESSGRPIWAQLQRQLPGQLGYFVVGAAFYLYEERARRCWPLLLTVCVAAYVVAHVEGGTLLGTLLEPVWLGIAVVFAARGLPHLGNFARFGDLSYGVYILHFPVIQIAVANGAFARDPWGAFAACVAVTAVLAFTSWHVIEKPFLNRRSHYRLAENRGATGT